jgi:hypothetical protein
MGSRLFGYNSGATVSGASQSGNLAVSNDSRGGGSVQWWNGPDEDLGYVIGYTDTTGLRKANGTLIGGNAVGFIRTLTKTDAEFLSLSNSLTGQGFMTASVAVNWLNTNGYYTSYSASVDTDAQAFITAAGITDSTQKTAINTLVVGLKADGIWTKMQAIYPFVGGSASTHKWNLKDPRDLNVAYRLSFNGGWTHSSNGVTPNGINGYADTFFDGNVGAIGCYNRNTSFTMGTNIVSSWGGGDYPYYQTPLIELAGANGSIQDTADGSNPLYTTGIPGPFVQLTYDTQQRLYINGNLNNSSPFYTSAPSAPTGFPIWVGGRNDNYGYSSPYYGAGTSSFAFISSGLNSIESSDLYTLVQAFQTTLGRQV